MSPEVRECVRNTDLAKWRDSVECPEHSIVHCLPEKSGERNRSYSFSFKTLLPHPSTWPFSQECYWFLLLSRAQAHSPRSSSNQISQELNFFSSLRCCYTEWSVIYGSTESLGYMDCRQEKTVGNGNPTWLPYRWGKQGSEWLRALTQGAQPGSKKTRIRKDCISPLSSAYSAKSYWVSLEIRPIPKISPS